MWLVAVLFKLTELVTRLNGELTAGHKLAQFLTGIIIHSPFE